MQIRDKLALYYRFLRTNSWRRVFRLVASRILLATGLCRFFTIRLGDTVLTFFPTKYSADLWFPGQNVLESYELPVLRPGDTVVDVGANIGVFTILFARAVGSSGQVVALEPNPTVYGYLAHNVARNSLSGSVRVLNVAAGERAGMARLEDRGWADTAGALTSSSSRSFQVRMEKLDSLLASPAIGPIRLVKIDTEGYERFVLEGGAATLARTDVVIVEVIDANCRRFGYRAAEVFAWLTDQGFHLFGLERQSGGLSDCEISLYLAEPDRFSYDIFGLRDPSLLNGVRWL